MTRSLQTYKGKMRQFYAKLQKVFEFVRASDYPVEEDRENVNLLVLQEMAHQGYEISSNFHSADAISGEIVVKIDDRLFEIGQCKQDTIVSTLMDIPSYANKHREKEPTGIKVTEILDLDSIIARMQQDVELRWSKPISRIPITWWVE